MISRYFKAISKYQHFRFLSCSTRSWSVVGDSVGPAGLAHSVVLVSISSYLISSALTRDQSLGFLCPAAGQVSRSTLIFSCLSITITHLDLTIFHFCCSTELTDNVGLNYLQFLCQHQKICMQVNILNFCKKCIIPLIFLSIANIFGVCYDQCFFL